MARANEGKVQFFGVAWRSSPAEVRSYVRVLQVPYPVAVDEDEAVFRAYSVPYQPVTFFITRSGRILERIAGEVPREKLEARVADLVARG